jgi:hypothetical protein
VSGAIEGVDEDAAPDSELVAQELGMCELRLETGVVRNVLARMRLSGVDEHPFDVRVAFGRFIEQRTLC